MKTCLLCKAVHPATAEFFYRNRKKRDGLTQYCKSCSDKKTARWRSAPGHPESRAEEMRKYRESENYQNWYKRNKELIVQRSREWRANHAVHSRELEREARLRRKYGMTVENYNRMLLLQNFGCAACRRRPDEELVIDHDHRSGRVRGLLCRHCNTVLGLVFEDPENLSRLANYIQT